MILMTISSVLNRAPGLEQAAPASAAAQLPQGRIAHAKRAVATGRRRHRYYHQGPPALLHNISRGRGIS